MQTPVKHSTRGTKTIADINTRPKFIQQQALKFYNKKYIKTRRRK